MEVAVVLNTHTDLLNTRDTLDSIYTHLGKKVLLIVDGLVWPTFEHEKFPIAKVKGFNHGIPKSPYRNVALGIKTLAETYPDADWYCYCEYDVLFTSDRFLKNLALADQRGVWMLGNDGHVDDKKMPLIESLVGGRIDNSYYLLGCCQFMSKHFMHKLLGIDFFERFLFLTNQFSPGVFPGYTGYDISEHMYPTLCRYFGGAIGVFATWDHEGKWHGSYRCFPMRWKPQLDPTENFEEASIMHPLKDYHHPIREFHREKRKRI